MRPSAEIVIIGGGINGLLTARELALTGACPILIDRGPVGREASWAGGGILAPLYAWTQSDTIATLYQISAWEYPDLAASLYDSTGIDPQLEVSGMLIIDPPDRDSAIKWCNRFRFRCEPVPSALDSGTAAIELTESDNLWLPECAHIRNPRLLQALKAELIRLGVRILENCPIDTLVADGCRIDYASGRNQRIYADRFIVAAGAWSSRLLDPFPPGIQIHPVKGQMLLFEAAPGLLKPIVLNAGRYLIPRKDGRILVGSSVEHCGFDNSVTEPVRTSLQQFAVSMVPELGELPVAAQWAGLRPGSPSGIPYICAHPNMDNLYLNCGHFRNGIATAPASARLVADLVLGRKPVINPDSCALDASRK